MKRCHFTPAFALLVSLAVAPAAFAQAKPKAPVTKAAATTPAQAPAQAPATKAAPATTPAPATRAKWVKPIKGTASIQFFQGASKRVGDDIVTLLKVKNMSDGAIALLKIDEYWYNKERVVKTGDTQRVTKPINPGDIAEITMKSPFKPDLVQRQFQFTHANGKVDVKPVKKLE
jgi:hypothetical protein